MSVIEQPEMPDQPTPSDGSSELPVELVNLVTKADRLSEQSGRELYQLHVEHLETLKDFAATHPLLQSMYDSPQITQDCLSHADPVVRVFALQLMRLPWRSQEAYLVACRKKIHDPDSGVASYALFGLEIHCAGSKDPELATMTASIVADPNKEAVVRCAAYQAFVSILGLNSSVPDCEDSATLSVIVDWDCLNRYLDR